MNIENTTQIDTQIEEIHYPYITFKIKDANYCISSRFVSSMTMVSDIIDIPNSPEYVFGLMRHKSGVIPMIDIRTLLGIPSLEVQYHAFIANINIRKQDHINWVTEFKRCIDTKEPFTLATDPHLCAFGKWFYTFKNTEGISHTINMVLKKLEIPHDELHSAALGYVENPNDAASAKVSYEVAEYLCHQIILPLLDELKDVFKAQYKSMAIILECDNKLQGITVDEVNSIKYFDHNTQSEKIKAAPVDNYINTIIKDSDGTLYLEIDAHKLISINKAIEEIEIEAI